MKVKGLLCPDRDPHQNSEEAEVLSIVCAGQRWIENIPAKKTKMKHVDGPALYSDQQLTPAIWSDTRSWTRSIFNVRDVDS